MDQVNMSGSLAPVEPSRRLLALDVLRGFALLGILLMNIEAFAGPLLAGLTGIDPSLEGPDLWADTATYILVQGKFYALFSLLFGMGIALMLGRAHAPGAAGCVAVRALALRRLLVLLVIGGMHAFLVWAGDILLAYAAVGLAFIAAFGDTPADRLRWWAIGMFCVPLALTWSFVLFVLANSTDPGAAVATSQALEAQAAAFDAMVEQQRAAHGPGGSYGDAVAANATMVRMTFTGYMPFIGPLLLAYFLAGAWFVRSGVILDPVRHAGTMRRLAVLGWGVGLPLVVLGAWLVPTMQPGQADVAMAWGNTATQVGSALMALGYLGLVTTLLQSPAMSRPLRWLAPAGRMALTNYLMQSVVCTLVFHGHGLGLFEQLPRAWQVPFVVVLFTLQVLASHCWLARFRHGPVEWLWRSLSYGSIQPFKRSQAVAT